MLWLKQLALSSQYTPPFGLLWPYENQKGMTEVEDVSKKSVAHLVKAVKASENRSGFSQEQVRNHDKDEVLVI